MTTAPATTPAVADKEPVKAAKPVAAAKPKSTPPAATTPKVVKAEGSKVTAVKKPAVTPQAFPQSAHLLQEEMVAWQKTPWELRVQAD